MFRNLFTLAACALFILPGTASAELIKHFYVNSKETTRFTPGKPAVIELQFLDSEQQEEGEDPEILTDFEDMHRKFMHLVIIKKDFSTFAHIHPIWDKSTGLFVAPVNLPMKSGDNLAAADALALPGDYFIYGEVKSRSLGFQKVEWDTTVSGRERLVRLRKDKTDDQGHITKYFDTEGNVAREGAKYKTVFSLHQESGCDGRQLEFNVDVSVRDSSDRKYVDLEKDEISRWLRMGGHGLVLSKEGKKAADKSYLHIHAARPETGDAFFLSHYDRDEMKPGLNKFWFQFKHKELILTLPYVFDFTPVPLRTDCEEADRKREAEAEHKRHMEMIKSM